MVACCKTSQHGGYHSSHPAASQRCALAVLEKHVNVMCSPRMEALSMSLQSLGISKMNLADRKGRGTPLLIRRKRIANAPILVIDIPRDFSREFSHTSSLCEQDHMATVPELSPGHELSPCTLNAAPSSPATTPTPADTNVQIQHRPAVSLPAVLLSPACLQQEGCRR